MPGTILTNCKIMLGGYDLSSYHNSLNVEFAPEMLDDTRFGTSGTRSFKPGLKTLNVTGGGFWDTELDEALYEKVGAIREVLSVAEVGEAEGDVAFTTRAVSGAYNPLSGEVGQLVPFELNFLAANSPLVRSRVLAYGSKAATGNSGAVQIGAASAVQRIYSGLHVVAAVATSIQVVVESSVDAGFAAPTVRLTHTLMTDRGADWKEMAGPVTDTYWRSTWTIVGGPFTIFHTVGIQ